MPELRPKWAVILDSWLVELSEMAKRELGESEKGARKTDEN